MSFNLPPIAKAAERLLLDIEQAVSRFPRRHRYTSGQELRAQAMKITEHTLRAERYLRYVDDFVLVHRDRDQLERWKVEIEQFLADRLGLALKDAGRLEPLTAGIDFLGYVVRPTHTTVRRRVVAHARAALADWERQHVTKRGLRGTPEAFRQARSIWASYEGHFTHADSHKLRANLHGRFPWLASAARPRKFHHALEGRHITIRSNSHG